MPTLTAVESKLLTEKPRFDSFAAERIVYLGENLDCLTDWEKEFVADRLRAFATFEYKAVLWPKQLRILNDIYLKVRSKDLVHANEVDDE